MNRQDGIHLDALAAALGETGDTALDIVRGTGIPLPKILRLLGLKGDEAGAVIGKKATTVYKYEAGTLWVSPGDLRALLNEYGVNMVTAFTEIGDPRAGGRKKDESALRWRKMRTYYDMMNPAKQRTLLDVARAMAEDF